MTVFWLLIACSGGGEVGEAPPAPETTVSAPEPPPVPAFDPLPSGVELLLEPARFQAQAAPFGLAGRLAKEAQEVERTTDVIVAELASVRTGAELGALMVEAPRQDPEIVVARLQRIREGLEAIRSDGPALGLVDAMIDEAANGVSGDAWVAVLQQHYPAMPTVFADHVGEENIPLVLAGAWMQGALLCVRAMRATGKLDAGPALLVRPEVGAYFVAWLDHTGEELFPESTLAAVRETLAVLAELSDNDPLTHGDAAVLQESLESLLGMI